MLTSQSVAAAFIELKQRQIEAWEQAVRDATEEVAQIARKRQDDMIGLANHVNLYRGLIEQNEKTIGMLKRLNGGPFNRISLGCLVTLQGRDGLHTFLIVPETGGCAIEVEGEKVTAMSIKAPVAQAILGKTVGEIVLCNGCHSVVCIR